MQKMSLLLSSLLVLILKCKLKRGCMLQKNFGQAGHSLLQCLVWKQRLKTFVHVAGY